MTVDEAPVVRHTTAQLEAFCPGSPQNEPVGCEEPGDTASMAAPLRVAILDDYQQAALALAPWDGLGDAIETTVFSDHVADLDGLANRLAPFDAVVAMRERTRVPGALLARLPRLRLLVSTGMGTAHIDLAAARERGIVVCGTGGSGRAPAELTWALILALARHVPEEDARIRAGGWGGSVGIDLAGATLGIVGLGRIGRQVATIGQAFGMHVLAWSPHLDPDAARAANVEPVARDALFERADVLTIHMVLSERTRGLVGAAELALLRPTALFVNTSRGALVDEPALVALLRAGRIGGAGLDVFEHEPLPQDHPLRSLPRTVVSPHNGYVARNGYATFYREAVEDIAAFLAGAPVRRLDQEQAP
jgi:phosphoglycerate dehydrogenase-like enzyme